MTVFAFGGIYASGTFNMPLSEVIVFGIVLNVVAGLGALAFGFVDDRIGGKRTGMITLVGIAAAVALGFAADVLAPNARAAAPVTLDAARAGTLLLRTGTAGAYVVAPTVATEVGIRVTGMVARTRLTQSFRNPGSEPVEGVYVFPLPEKAAVDHLQLRIGEREIEGVIRDKAQARGAYEQAKREGRKAALVEQQRPNLFTNSVAHIGPGETVRVTIEYQQSLAYENGRYRLRFPLAYTPRYPPVGGAGHDALLQPAYAAGGGGPLVDPGAPVDPVDIAVAIDAGVPLGELASSYHDVRIERRDGNAVLVSLVKDQEEADHDFELTWTLAPGAAPRRRPVENESAFNKAGTKKITENSPPH